MLAGVIAALGGWAWVVFGLALLAAELVVPGTVLLWLGFAALVVGGLSLLAAPGWQAELIVFAVLSLAAAVGWWLYGRPDNAAVSDRPMLNRRAQRHVGKTLTLDEPIARGEGRVRIDDSVWRVRGPDLPAGARVTVTGADGATLTVEPAAD
ncbi:NfeD family protein [Methylopila musalis]|uniref:NfeD family protein n=1 Tax=Methylopila musalis TaxID=1134781 RepID=A0ABW3Z9A7_9HYPH